ncbi:unnamed protein product, partial [Mesorhabditis belari]|uniref:S1 motif domain-containing protein n=1 Tax=Mesorhabditis belari TaxID=2138241 RepID=A0AAF3JC18_9BILA
MAVKEEVDFPRAQRKRSAKAQDEENEVVKEKKLSLKSFPKKLAAEGQSKVKKRKEKIDDEFSGVWTAPVKAEDLTEGVFGVGIVEEIRDTEVILRTAGNLQVSLPAANIGKKFLEQAKKNEVTLEDVVAIGQMLSFRVQGKPRRVEEKKTKRSALPIVSCTPSAVNQHIALSHLVPGLVLTANVTSIEEKGTICDIGIAGHSGFIAGVALLQESQPIMVRIESVKSRIVNLSLHVEGENLADSALEDFHLNHLTPGTILYGEPEKHTPNGVYVNLGNNVRGFISSRLLPPRLRVDPSRLVKALRVIVLFCQQNSNLLVLGGHPDIIAISKPEKRTVFQGIQIGDIITCRVASVGPKVVLMTLPEDEDGKQSLISVVAGVKALQNPNKIAETCKINSEHLCRVTGFNTIERTIYVSTKKEVLNQQMISYKDAQVGAIVDGKVVSYARIGLFVRIFDSISGFVPLKWATERAVKDLDKIFPIGNNVRLRVLSTDIEHKNLVLTTRQKLVNYKGKLVTEYTKSMEGKTTIGLVTTIFDHGAALIAFFNNITGYMPAEQVKQLKTESPIREGSIVEVLISNCDIEKGRYLVHTVDGVKGSEVKKSEKSTKKEKSADVKLFGIFTGKVVGPWKAEDAHERGKFGVEILMPNNKKGRLHASELPEKYLVDGTKPIERFLSEMKGKSVNVKVIGFIRKKQRVPELTMQASKLTETKKKQKLFEFKNDYRAGDLIPVFSFGAEDTALQRKFEVTPVFTALLPRQKLPLAKLITDPNAASKLVDVDFDEGEMRLARVVGLNRKARIVDITFAENEDVEIGETTPGRVLSVSTAPHGILFQLANGQLAHLGPSGVTNLYKKTHTSMREFSHGQLYNVVIASQAAPHAPKKQTWEVVTEKRWTQRKAGTKNRLLTLMSDVESAAELQGFVINESPCIVELGAGVQATMQTEGVDVKVNDVVTVKIQGIDELKKMLGAKLLEVVQRACLVEKDPHSSSESFPVKKRKMNQSSEAERVESGASIKSKTEKKQVDPGWEFSATGFSAEDLVKVTKLLDEDGKPGVAEVKKEEATENDGPPSKKRNKTERIIDVEKELVAAESRIIEGNVPENESEFGIMLQRNPNSAQLWIRFMGYFLNKNDLTSARSTAQRALKSINYREDTERLAMWTAYLNMEISFGSGDSWKPVFEEACNNADSLKMHKQTAAALALKGRNEEADEIYNQLVKRFRKFSDEVWILYASFLMSTKRFDEARDLLKKALNSVPKAEHVTLISRFATLEFEKGDMERGRTLFENVLSNFPKKVDVWSVYLDLTMKHDAQDKIRNLFDRICSLSLTNHKLRPFYKKWAEYEAKFGDEKTQNELRERAAKLLRAD